MIYEDNEVIHFNATGLFTHPLKTSKNQRFSNVSGGKKISGMKWVTVKSSILDVAASLDPPHH